MSVILRTAQRSINSGSVTKPFLVFFVACVLGLWAWQRVSPQEAKPLTLGQVLTSLRSTLAAPEQKNRLLIEGVRKRGVTFKLIPEIEDELKAEGASDELLEAIREKSSGSNSASTPVPTPSPAPTPVPTLTPMAQPRTIQNRYGIEMVLIPPGSFIMGSTHGNDNERPVHRVTISYFFYMGRTEVTQAQGQQVMGSNPSHFKGDNLPVEQVSWDDAQAFVDKLNQLHDSYFYRLPSEAEWEYACRAGSTGDYADALDSMAWYSDNSGGTTHEVGTKQANAFGLYDMHGNVWEWCEDWYHSSYNGAPLDGSAWLNGGEQKYRVLRGGSWFSHGSNYTRSAYRGWYSPELRFNYVGFRVVAVART